MVMLEPIVTDVAESVGVVALGMVASVTSPLALPLAGETLLVKDALTVTVFLPSALWGTVKVLLPSSSHAPAATFTCPLLE